MRSANHSAPLQGLRLYKALLGLIQASGLAGGFDFGCFTFRRNVGEVLVPRQYGTANLNVPMRNGMHP